jgi:hypothetical protein
MRYEDDWKHYQEFLRAWADATLDESNPVYRKVEQASLKVCRRFGRVEDAPGLIQISLISLAKGQYKNEYPLDNYIASIMLNELRRRWQKEGQGKVDQIDEIDDDLIDERSSGIAEEVLQKISSEEFVNVFSITKRIYFRRKVKFFVRYRNISRENLIVTNLKAHLINCVMISTCLF